MRYFTKGWFPFSNQLKVVVLTLPFMFGTALTQTSNSIKSILNPDGSLKTAATIGSFDARGYKMVTEKDGAPRFIQATSDPNDKNWDQSFTVAGIGGWGYIAANSGDTVLYVGGNFGSAGNLVTNNIAAYNLTTNTWYSLDTTSANLGINGPVASIIINGNDVYIGGTFSSAGGIAANNIVDYNTSTNTWNPLGSGTNGVNGGICAMAYFGGNLYVGGSFTTAGGGSVSDIARWDGSSWHALGSGVDNVVYALGVSGGYLYAGGSFTHAGGDTAHNIASWNGTNWSYVGKSKIDVSNTVEALVFAGSSLYIGGSFTTAGGITVNGIAKWNGTAWSAVGAGVSGNVYYLTFYGSKLYVAGSFITAGLSTVNNIAAVDTSTNTWSALGTGSNVGTNGIIEWPEMGVANGKLYIAGQFSTAGGISAKGIASWNGTNWSSLGGSPNSPGGSVYALALSGSNIYVGGSFPTAGSIQTNNIAVYNTSTHTWSSLGTGTANGVDNQVYTIAVSTGSVYVGGAFTHAGGNPANHIAMWDGSKWNTLGTSPNDGVNNSVYALGMFGTDLYVGGNFTTAGGSAANYVAKWSSNAWSTLGSGVNHQVNAIGIGVNEIYFGGAFTTAGGSSANYVASWNGTSWSALGTPTNGVNHAVNALATYADTVFVGGAFTTAGGNAANYAAKWNTHQWTPLGAGVNGSVNTLAINGTNLFVGGNFTASGLNNAYYVVEWSIADSSFSTLGDGLNAPGEAIISTGNDTYVGGGFSTAGNKPSYCFARYNTNIALIPTTPVLISPLNGTTGVARRTTFSWNASTNATSYHLQVASSNAIDSVGGFVSANVIFDTTLAVTTEKLSTPLTATTVYYWHISATGTAGTSAYSAATLFTTGVGIDAVDNPGGIPKQF
ncbi:MAG TPA: hypothetical protein VLX91_01295, partial [Candidatus Acidoferrales bacterium]|nr:hypothetical protein [Candidatus Acidoferrales bacterium]